MRSEEYSCQPLSVLRLQSWLSPNFPNGAYSYSHGLERAVEAGHVYDRASVVDWLEADLCYGSGRNEAIFFSEAYRCAVNDDNVELIRVAEVAAVSRGTSEFALESSQQSNACLTMLRKVWPHPVLDVFQEKWIPPVMAVVLGCRSAKEEIPAPVALAAFLHNYVANLVIAGVRLIPLGQTDGQLAVSELERAVIFASSEGPDATLEDLGSAGFLVELTSIEHENQYTRLFRS